jgi:hypothetical protein
VIRPYRGPGRPKLEHPKRLVTLRLDADLLDRLRETGPGRQSRLNDAVRAWTDTPHALSRQPCAAAILRRMASCQPLRTASAVPLIRAELACLPCHTSPMLRAMFIVSEAEAAAIRAASWPRRLSCAGCSPASPTMRTRGSAPGPSPVEAVARPGGWHGRARPSVHAAACQITRLRPRRAARKPGSSTP